MSEPVPMASGADAGSVTSPRQSLLQGLVRTARPKQWMKNVLVVAAPAAAGVMGRLLIFGGERQAESGPRF